MMEFLIWLYYGLIISAGIIFWFYYLALENGIDGLENLLYDGNTLVDRTLLLELQAIINLVPFTQKIVIPVNEITSDVINQAITIATERFDSLRRFLTILVIVLEAMLVLLIIPVAFKWLWLMSFLSIFGVVGMFMVVQTYDPIIGGLAKYQKIRRSTRPLSLIQAVFLNLLTITVLFWSVFGYQMFEWVLIAFSAFIITLLGYSYWGTYKLQTGKKKKKPEDTTESDYYYSIISDKGGHALRFFNIVTVLFFIILLFLKTDFGQSTKQVIKAGSSIVLQETEKLKENLSDGFVEGRIVKKTVGFIKIDGPKGIEMVPKYKISRGTKVKFTDYSDDRLVVTSHNVRITMIGILARGKKLYVDINTVTSG